MRILLLADIHANWPALQAINEPHDVCLFLGDLVDYGLEPTPCIQWVRRHAHHAVRGNHDRFLRDRPVERLAGSDRFAHDSRSAGTANNATVASNSKTPIHDVLIWFLRRR